MPGNSDDFDPTAAANRLNGIIGGPPLLGAASRAARLKVSLAELAKGMPLHQVSIDELRATKREIEAEHRQNYPMPEAPKPPQTIAVSADGRWIKINLTEKNALPVATIEASHNPMALLLAILSAAVLADLEDQAVAAAATQQPQLFETP